MGKIDQLCLFCQTSDMIIDFHAHIYPQQAAAKVFSAAKKKLKVEVPGTGSPEDLAMRAARANIDATVILPLARGIEDVSALNRWVCSVAVPGQIPFGAIHPLMPDLAAELDRLEGRGCQGVKMMPLLQAVFPDDPRCGRLYEEVTRRDMILITHAGKDPMDREEVYGTPDRFARVVESYPEMRLVLAHLGGLRMWEEVRRHLLPAGGRVFFDTAYVSFYLNGCQMKELIEEIGPERVVFGSDYPWEDPGRALGILKGLDLANQEEMAGGNARRLLGLP
ncbi:MAG TPA: amidohydrolase family protein [Methanotrichaceae archaeon]|nr:amidohydrolase family protein [Methanotrichaceae archaeon]